jgi:hypothetical protein
MLLEWDPTDATLLYWRCTGDWSWQDYVATLEALREDLARQAVHRVDIICDVTGSTMTQPGMMMQLERSSPAMTLHGGWWGITVFVGAGEFAKASLGLLRMINRVLGQRYYTADTPEEARGIIMTYRAGKASAIA